MAFSIQTNVNSLIAQENLRVNNEFQSRTIQRLTSGFRINQSGDDAAGLAIANKFRSDIAELTQGVRNANDGVAQLQIMDGGMNNIGKMLDRLKTLATQSASSTFTGDRSVLNKEYQTLVQEIDRQAQSIGLSTGARFATRMSVFIGGGASKAGAVDTANGSVALDFSNAVVDTKGLGLRTTTFQATGATGSDIGSGSVTSVSKILADSNNTTTATFNFSGPGFSGLSVSVSLSGVTDTDTLVARINDAISLAGNAGTDAAVAFRDAGISASIETDSSGAKRLAFSSAGEAFQVQANTKAANALMGNFKAEGSAEGADVTPAFTGAAAVSTAAPGGATTVNLRLIVNGTVTDKAVSLVAADDLATEKLTAVQTALAGTGVSAELDGGKLKFTGPAGKSLEVQVSGDKSNYLGLGTWQGGFAATSYTGGTADVGAGHSLVLELSLNGGDKIAINVDATSLTTIKSSISNAVAQNAALKAAGITAVDNGGADGIVLSSSNSVNFRWNIASVTGGANLQLSGAADTTGTASAGSMTALNGTANTINVSGASSTGLGSSSDVFSFAALRNHDDTQTLSFSATDDTGALQSVSVDLTSSNADSIDDALSAINDALQDNDTTKHIVAVKEMNAAGTAEGIRFVSSLGSFSVKALDADNFSNQNPVGLFDGTAGAAEKQGMSVDSSESGTLDISTMSGAKEAVVAIGEAVSALGTAQAAIGKGQNQLSYAVTLAQSQISNYSAAESRIRDADIASEAANLTKAQVLQQASMAAMAQANSAPQAVLALLRG